jgi:hypothetical protein
MDIIVSILKPTTKAVLPDAGGWTYYMLQLVAYL